MSDSVTALHRWINEGSACCGAELQAGICGYCGRPAQPLIIARPVPFYVWNTAGSLAMTAGRLLHGAGLWLCGLAGDLDAIADRYR